MVNLISKVVLYYHFNPYRINKIQENISVILVQRLM